MPAAVDLVYTKTPSCTPAPSIHAVSGCISSDGLLPALPATVTGTAHAATPLLQEAPSSAAGMGHSGRGTKRGGVGLSAMFGDEEEEGAARRKLVRRRGRGGGLGAMPSECSMCTLLCAMLRGIQAQQSAPQKPACIHECYGVL